MLLVAFLWDDLGLWGSRRRRGHDDRQLRRHRAWARERWAAEGLFHRPGCRRRSAACDFGTAGADQRLLILLGNAVTPGRASARTVRLQSSCASRRPGQGSAGSWPTRTPDDPVGVRTRRHPAREVMVPRTEMVDRGDKTAGQATSLAVRSGHSRIPVIGENVDDVVGSCTSRTWCSRPTTPPTPVQDTKVTECDARPLFVPDSETAGRPAPRDAGATATMALLVDEYGAIAGLVDHRDVARRSSARSPTSTTPTRWPGRRRVGDNPGSRVSRRGCPSRDLAEL